MTPSTQPLLFVSCYGPAGRPNILAYRFDESSGALAPCGSVAGIANPGFLAVHPNGRWLYASSETSAQGDGVPGSVWSLRCDTQADPVTFEPVNHQVSGGDGPCHVRLDATGRWVLVANYGSGGFGVLPIQPDGSLGALTDYVQHQGHGPNTGRQEGPHAHSTIVSPDNGFVIVADLGIDQLVIYRFDAAAGKVQPHGHGEARPGAGPRHMAFHPNGRILYVANELDNTVAAYDYDAAAGTLVASQLADLLPPDAPPDSTAADIHISPAGDRLYVSNRSHNSLSVFSVSAAGELQRLAVASCGGRTPRNFTLAPGGGHVLVGNQDSGEVAVLPLSPRAEEVGAPIARMAAPQVACLQWVPLGD